MKRTDDQIRCQFFKELSAAERLKVLRVFLDIPDAAAAEVSSHSIEAKLLSEILRPAVQAGAEQMRKLEIAIAERNHARAKFDRVFRILMSVHSLTGPGQDFKMPDGRVLRFMDPNAAETLHHLSAAIKAIPDRLAEFADSSPRATADVEREAARYRWLRDKSDPGICAFYLSVGKAFDGVNFTQETVDKAIDAQIATTKPGA